MIKEVSFHILRGMTLEETFVTSLKTQRYLYMRDTGKNFRVFTMGLIDRSDGWIWSIDTSEDILLLKNHVILDTRIYPYEETKNPSTIVTSFIFFTEEKSVTLTWYGSVIASFYELPRVARD